MVRRLTRPFAELRVWQKLLLGYIIVILLPSAVFIGAYIAQARDRIYEEYRLNDHRSLEQSYSNLKARLKMIEGYSDLFQHNSAVITYLQGYYLTESEEVYAYLKDIQPLISFLYTANPDLIDVTLYTYRKARVPLRTQIVYLDTSAEEIADMPIDGAWSVDTTGDALTLGFEKPVYTFQYRRKEAYLSIRLKLLPVLSQFMPDAQMGTQAIRIGGAYYVQEQGALVPVEALPAGDYLVSEVDLTEIDATMIALTPKSEATGAGSLALLTAQLIGLLLLLSVLYYVIVASVTRRLSRFTTHLRGVDLYALNEYTEATGGDEVGFLVTTYNEMIVRTRTLLDDLNVAELKKKEAAFHALQAQIKPHFIFNALETIRMMAEGDGNEDVSDALYNLGNFIRYSMNSRTDHITLSMELDNVGHYLLLCKARMQDRLSYAIQRDGSADSIHCPSFILQPLVENSIHHAARDPHTPLHIAVTALREGEACVITVADDGIGIPPERLAVMRAVIAGEAPPEAMEAKGSGIGIANVSQRIAEFYGAHAIFAIESELGRGTRCHIRIQPGGMNTW